MEVHKEIDGGRTSKKKEDKLNGRYSWLKSHMKTSGVGRVAEDDKTDKEAGAMAPVLAGNDGQ